MVHNRWGGDARGGAERVVERLVNTLRVRGHDVEVYCRTTAGFTALGRLPSVLRAFWHAGDACNVIAAIRLRAVLRRARPDLVHTHNLIGCGGLTPWVIRQSGIPWMHTLHDVQLLTPSGILVRDEPQTRMERSPLGVLLRAFRRRMFGSPTLVVSPSQWLLDRHRSAGFFPRSRTATIGNPVDLPDAVGPARSGAVRRFVFVGQVEGVKGVEVLAEAFRRVRHANPDITLQIVGDGSRSLALRRIARDIRGISLRGRLDAGGVRTAISESDVLVVPSLVAENQPSVILESFAVGVPVVASRVGGIPEIVADGETGFLVAPGSVDDLARALQLCVEEPKRVRAMHAACRSVAEEHATERIVAAYEAAYRRARSAI